MVAVLITLRAKEGHDGELARVLVEGAQTVRRNEPGCTCYQITRARASNGIFKIFQVYASEQALDEHRRTPHAKVLGAALEAHLAEPGSVEFLDLVE